MNKPKGFTYQKTNVIYMAHYKDGKWEDGVLQKDDQISISVMAPALHYGQQCFEGMKAYRRSDGKIQLFRIKDNATRFQESARRLVMPPVSIETFEHAVIETVKANSDFVPDNGTGATLYIRPLMIGVGENLGLRPAKEFIFMVITSPVGAYFEEGIKPVDLIVSEYDRAAPHGTGDIKVGGNYAASLYPQVLAKQQGYADCLFLDPKTHTKIEEVGAANFFGITKENVYITPKSPSILNSITNRSIRWLAEHKLGLKVVEGDVYIDQLDNLVEAGACGTAALITPVGSITHYGIKHVFPYNKEMGPISKQLYDLLSRIQFGEIEDPNNWVTILD
ncbi:MAG: branched-chain amino acid aminotransferase [Acholeplasmataceae bacterium]|nr:branched-chain amino acid aminotransferase [Acholeplasmataceae bacterium]MDD4203662.1 branched-chain amino acid aminotransferase [Acholeplasmataceae bacterium]MDD4824556.1 branched-chain amino acid aminotransferase [Acholeplasmataceae bacterium]